LRTLFDNIAKNIVLNHRSYDQEAFAEADSGEFTFTSVFMDIHLILILYVNIVQVLDRKVPKSSKYAHIEAKLDTGLTIHKVKPITAHEYRMRREEIFYRVTKNQLYDLFNEYEADERESINALSPGNPREERGPRVVTYSDLDEPEYSKPYLILDVREPENYNICHILQAKSYPYTMIRRDYLLPEIYQFKNKPEHLIILYCDDERISRDTAKTMVDRGIDNVYLLEGGLKEFASHYPAFVEGHIPERLLMTPPKSGLTRSRMNIFYILHIICFGNTETHRFERDPRGR
jgi:rhodanese-related sulfurtransferase